jgi:transposase
MSLSRLHNIGLLLRQEGGLMKRHAVTDDGWKKVEDLFPANGKRGGQWKDHRLMLDAMLWILKTGVPWRDLPERFGPWNSVYDRFSLWTKQGLWGQILDRLGSEGDPAGLDWTLVCIDGTLIRAHRHAASKKPRE